MSIRLLMRSALFLTAGLLAVSAAPAVAAQDAAITLKVKQIYKNDCALCHGENGNGKSELATQMSLTLADYTDPKSLSGKSDQELFAVIRNGKDKMPPEEESRAKDAEVRGLILYVRSLSKGGQTAAAPPAAPPGKH